MPEPRDTPTKGLHLPGVVYTKTDCPGSGLLQLGSKGHASGGQFAMWIVVQGCKSCATVGFKSFHGIGGLRTAILCIHAAVSPCCFLYTCTRARGAHVYLHPRAPFLHPILASTLSLFASWAQSARELDLRRQIACRTMPIVPKWSK
jgi:hypothetical protein